MKPHLIWIVSRPGHRWDMHMTAPPTPAALEDYKRRGWTVRGPLDPATEVIADVPRKEPR